MYAGVRARDGRSVAIKHVARAKVSEWDEVRTILETGLLCHLLVISCAMSCTLVMMSKVVGVLADVFIISSVSAVSCVKSHSYMCSLVFDVSVVPRMIFLCLLV